MQEMASGPVSETPLDPPSRGMARSPPQNVTFDFAMSAILTISKIRRPNEINSDVLTYLFRYPLFHAGNVL